MNFNPCSNMTALRALVFLAILSCCSAANFVMFPMFGRSHYMFVARLGQELAERGHQVKIFVGATQSYAANDSNVRVYNDDKLADTMMRRASRPSSRFFKTASDLEQLRFLFMFQTLYCDDLLGNSEVMEDIKHADLVVGEILYLCSALVADKFGIPHVIISAATLSTPTGLAFGIPSPPSYVPQWGAPLTHELKFVDRVKNVIKWMLWYGFYIYDLCPMFNGLKVKHGITPSKNIHETLGRVDLILGQMDFVLEDPRPLLPNTRVVGPFLPSPARPLPNELDRFMQEAGDEGVILVSFGTVLEEVDETLLQLMAKAFSKLPQKIVWRIKGTSKVSVSDNVKVSSWLPQNDILGHPKTRLFIGHAGLNGIFESTYHGVPMICSPFFGDQFVNAQIAKQVGFAEIVDLEATSAEDFVSLIHKVLTQPSYRESARRISKSVQRLPRPPIKEAADWVEYTQAQGGLQYLRPRGLDLPFYQLYLLDILFLVFLVFVFVVFVIGFLLKSVVKIFVGATQSYAANDSKARVYNDDKIAALFRNAPETASHEVKIMSDIEQLRILLMHQSCYCDDLLSNAKFMEEISHADLVVGEILYLCSALIADKFDIPHVIISATSLSTPTGLALGLPSPPSYVPQWGASLTHELRFVDRVKNVVQRMLMYLYHIYDLCPMFNELKVKHGITPGKSIYETLGRVDLVLGQMDFSLEGHPRPLLPNTRVVGPFLPSPPKPLPDELDQFMQESGDEGVILVSFGTVVGELDETLLQMMSKAFSELPQKIIWKLKDTSKVTVSDNVKLLSWLPQNDILGHPKTRLFIAHAGINGLYESTYHGVPMICSPFFGDQPVNAQMAKQSGFAEVVDLEATSAEDFVSLIHKVLTQPSYRETAGRISKSIQRLPRPPIKEAADWVEYTQAQGGLQYLRPRGLDLPFYQLYLLDILFLAVLVLVVALFVVRCLLKSVISCLSRSSEKEKAN